MHTVGIRELKAKLSEYLRRVQEGESFTVTDRGATIARLGPESLYPDLGAYDDSSLVCDPGTLDLPAPRKTLEGKKEKKKSYATLLKETQNVWGYKSPKETLTKALEEHLRYKKQLSILDLAGTIDYDPNYDHKAARRKR